MRYEYGPMEHRWYREGNGARFIDGLSQPYTVPLGCGHRILILATGLDEKAREDAFGDALWLYWFATYGYAEARARMFAYVHGGNSVA